jgi:hypothetical protein
MNFEKFLDVSTLEANPLAEGELQRLRPFVESRIEQAYQNVKDAIGAIAKATPQAEPVLRKVRPVFWEAVSLSDVVYRRVVAVLNLARDERHPLKFEDAAERILKQTPARDAPEQASFMSFIDRLYTLWRTLKESGYYRSSDDKRFAVDAILPLRPLHCGTNAMNANFVPGKRHYIAADETRTFRMCGRGQHSAVKVVIRPTEDGATEVQYADGVRKLTAAEPTLVLGRPLWINELFTLQVVDDAGKASRLTFPVDAEITKDPMYSRGAIRLTRTTAEDGEARIIVTENGTFYDVDLGDRLYISGPDANSGLHGMTRFLNLRTSPSEESDAPA